MVNEIEPYAFSIVDTFGSMYKEDLQRVFFLIHHNLVATSKVGFHSHNNLQMSFALSQEFAEMTQGLRKSSLTPPWQEWAVVPATPTPNW